MFAFALQLIFNETIRLGLALREVKLKNATATYTSKQFRARQSDEYLSKLGSQAIAGAGTGKDGKIGAAGALAIITSFAKTQAYIAPNAQITDAGIISITAEETSKLAVRAWGFSAGTGKVGAGAAFAIIYGNNQIHAYIGKGDTVSPRLNQRRKKRVI